MNSPISVSTEKTSQRAVLVTGASTGIGRRTTEYLATRGYFVYAGVRKESDVRAFSGFDNVQALRLDVTKPEEIGAAVKIVTEANRGLYGLINNAGVLTIGPIIHGFDDEFELVMDVNVGGPYRVTKAFAPLIIAERGRIVTIGSVAGTGIVAIKNVGIYSMSKHAVEALTDSLAVELEPLGVHVSVIEPGGFKTEIYDKTIARIGMDSLMPDISEYGDPEEVAATVGLALFEPRPKRRYLVVSTELIARKTICKQIAQLVQSNEGHRYTFDRQDLVRMLDDAMVQSRPKI